MSGSLNPEFIKIIENKLRNNPNCVKNDEELVGRFPPPEKDVVLEDLKYDIKAFDETLPKLYIRTKVRDEELINKDLSNRNFDNRSFDHLDLSNFNLSNSTFRNSTFYHTNFNHAILINADFTDANLQDCSLHGADLSNSIFVRANLYGAIVTTVIENANFSDSILMEAEMEEVMIINSNFTKAKLMDANMRKASITDSDFSFSDFSEANVSKAFIKYSNFENSIFKKTNLYKTDIAELVNVDFSEAIFEYDDPRY